MLLHAGLFFALQSGLGTQLPTAPAAPKELFATFITPGRPAVASPPEPQAAPPRPGKKPASQKIIAPRKTTPIPMPPVAAAPAQQAIGAPPESPAAPGTPSAQEAGTPAATAPTVTVQPKTISSGVEYLQPPQPRYPPLSRRMGEEGRAILRVLVSAQGMPERAEIRTSSGSARLDEAAREAVLRAQFLPHLDNGQAVAVFVIVPIRFQLNN